MRLFLTLALILSAQSALALDQNDLKSLLARQEVQSLHRIKGSSISSINIEKAEKVPGFEGNVIVILNYEPKLTREEIENEEGPGTCGARIQYTYGQYSRIGLDLSEVKVLNNLCFQ